MSRLLRVVLKAALAAALAGPARAKDQEPKAAPAVEDAWSAGKIIPVWPDRAPGSESWTQKQVQYRNDWDHKTMVRNVTTPTLTAFLPDPSAATGAAVVICPGGGFRFLSWESEGTEVAEWLRARGIAGFVLKYRVMETPASEEEFRKEMMAFLRGLANRSDRPAADEAVKREAPKDQGKPGESLRRGIPEEARQIATLGIADGRQAIKVVRRRAAEWGIKPDRVGIMGFSAGGMVTMGVVMDHDSESRPDFAAPIYGGGTGNAKVPDDAPPLFILCASDDRLAAAGSAHLYSEWKAAGRPVELHIYEKGGHGFGMTPKGLPVDRWIERYGDWLEQRGLIKPGAASQAKSQVQDDPPRENSGVPGPSPADADAKSALSAAVRKLAEAPSYRWTTTVTAGDLGPLGGGSGVTTGQVERGGYTRIALPTGAGRLEFVTRAGKAAVLVEGNWQTLDQASARGGSPASLGLATGFDPGIVTHFKIAADRAADLLRKADGFRRQGATVTATLSPEAAGEILVADGPAFLRRRGSPNAPIKDPRGSASFRVADGVLTEFTLKLSGSRQLFGNEVKLDRTTTTKIGEVGSTKVDVPVDAREIVEALIAGRKPDIFVPEPGFKKLFDGRTLAGWRGKEGLWSVEDGAIVGRTTKEHPTQGNTFLFARAGDKDLIVDDFELRLLYRITADNDENFANSGIQYRSKDRGNFVAAGYQADFEAGPTFSGIVYDEAGGAGGRGIMAMRGEQVTWTPGGKKEVTGHLGKSAEIQAKIKKDDWNEYVVIARGDHLQHFINGVPTADVFDEAEGKRLSSGILALQLHAGQPMTVRFKDIRIKSLSSAAESAVGNVKVAKGFKLDLIYSVPKVTQGSWVALCVDPKGRLIAADQNGKLYRLKLPAPGRSAAVEPEAIEVELAGAHGLLYAFDSLYAMVNERGTHGLYRVRDTDGDDRYDEVKLLREIKGGGEHGMHSIVLAPDGKSLFVVCGNNTQLTKVHRSRVPLNWGEDNLVTRIPTGFMDDSLAPQGWIARTDPEGKQWELIAAGMRNPFDIAFNREGELFTYDADMEWDIGEPWYRPTRVNHIISGAEFGFRNGSGKWPDYYIDSFGAVVDIGPGSPTGVTFGYGANFPDKYREALFISDWSFGKLRAVHLRPQGASYTAEVEEFLSGQPLPVTDVVINPQDGAMYLAVGGRGAQSALYRLTYVGGEVGSTSRPDPRPLARQDLRRELEGFHGHRDVGAVEAVWSHLGDQDRAIRYAARVALEWQDPSQWQEKALGEADPRTAIAALVALARVSGRDAPHRKPTDPTPDPALRGRVLAALDGIDWSRLGSPDRVDLLRAYSLVFTRLGRPDDETCRRLAARFDPLFPARALEVDFLLAEILAYLQAPTATAKVMAALREASTQEEQIHYALMLRVLKAGWTRPLREEYFRWFVTEAAAYRGGNTFANSLRTIKAQAMKTLSDDELAALKPILDAHPAQRSPQDLLAARKPIKEWTVAELLPVVERGLGGRRDLERGRRLYGAVACAACHRFGQEGGGVGPDLTAVAGRFGVRDLLDAIVEPSKVISDQYAAVSIATKDGHVVTGRVGNIFGDSLSVIEDMFDPGRTTMVRRADIEEMKPSEVSLMPVGLFNSLTEEEIQDLIAFLLARGDSRAEPSRP